MRTYDEEKLSGRHIVIIGGSSGVGLALARSAARAGARLTLLGRSQDKLLAAAAGIERVTTRTIDLTRANTIPGALQGIGDVDHLVVSAGTVSFATLADSSAQDWRAALEERIVGPLTAVKMLGPRISTSIVLFSGTVARRPSPGATMLSVVAAAVEAAVRSLALELAPLRVNAVRPGMLDTPMTSNLLGESKAQVFGDVARRLPARRIGTPEDAAHAAMFLMTNPFVTGTTIDVDGGAQLV